MSLLLQFLLQRRIHKGTAKMLFLLEKRSLVENLLINKVFCHATYSLAITPAALQK
jgi:hypothetical protein